MYGPCRALVLREPVVSQFYDAFSSRVLSSLKFRIYKYFLDLRNWLVFALPLVLSSLDLCRSSSHRTFSMAPKTVAVCGATGQQGGATVDALLTNGSGVTIKALTRDPTAPKAAALAAKGVEPVKAEFDDVESLKAAFEGCDAVFAVTDFWAACGLDPFKELQQGKKHLSVGTAAHQLLD